MKLKTTNTFYSLKLDKQNLFKGRSNDFQSGGAWTLRSGISLCKKVKHAIL